MKTECNLQYFTLHGKPFFFPDALQRWSFWKNCAGTWSFLYYPERLYILFPKRWSYTFDTKWKTIFLKNTWKSDIFFRPPKKMVFPKGAVLARDLSYIIWKDGFFFSENMIFFHRAESERRSFQGNRWRRDASPSKKKQETWYIEMKLRLSLNSFGQRYPGMSNPQYFVPFSPQGLCLWVCLVAKMGNYLSIRG